MNLSGWEKVADGATAAAMIVGVAWAIAWAYVKGGRR